MVSQSTVIDPDEPILVGLPNGMTDITTCLLRETNTYGHAKVQRGCIGILSIACGIGEWVEAEARRSGEAGR